jgi:hypothetical protein
LYKEVNEHLPATPLALRKSFILGEICVKWKGRRWAPPRTSPLNQRLSQLIYSALEKVRVLLLENVPGTYKIYSNAINIIP